jgi:putative Holliday junction resolvase
VVGVDPGTKRIGVAMSDSARSLAFPRPSVPAGDEAITKLVELVREESVDLVVVGRPISLNGTDTASTANADAFRDELAAQLSPICVIAFDERLTTVSAQRQLSNAGLSARGQRDVIDSAAATVLLQSFLDRDDA